MEPRNKREREIAREAFNHGAATEFDVLDRTYALDMTKAGTFVTRDQRRRESAERQYPDPKPRRRVLTLMALPSGLTPVNLRVHPEKSDVLQYTYGALHTVGPLRDRTQWFDLFDELAKVARDSGSYGALRDDVSTILKAVQETGLMTNPNEVDPAEGE